MSLRKLICLPLTVLWLASTALSVPPPPSIVGVWDFELDVTHVVARDGFVKKERHFYEWVIRFRRNGNELTGDLIGGKGSRGEGVCADAAIEGSINGRSVQFTVTYQGPCCKDEQMVFAGELDEDGTSLTGKLKPVDIPKSNCSLAYANVKATKRDSRRNPD
jgi:hypothetical protein